MTAIRAICFDAFGTIVEITDKRRPFHALQREQARTFDESSPLTKALSLREIAVTIRDARLAELEADLEAECASIRLRPGMDLIWASLRSLDLKIGVCSNLAAPYERPLLACLPGIPDALVLSFQVGLIKPHPAIYRMVCAKLHVLPAQVLFVGDTLEADVLGPRAAGLLAMPIDEFQDTLAKGQAASAPPALVELFQGMRGELNPRARG